jgi:hypothetical protein
LIYAKKFHPEAARSQSNPNSIQNKLSYSVPAGGPYILIAENSRYRWHRNPTPSYKSRLTGAPSPKGTSSMPRLCKIWLGYNNLTPGVACARY